MFKRVLVLAIVAGAIVFAGCNEKSGVDGAAGASSAGRVAVVDLNKIAVDIGYQPKIEEARQVRERNLQISARVLQQKTQAQLVTLAEEIGKIHKAKGDKPTEAEQKLIDEWIAKRQKLERTRMDAGNKLNQLYTQQRRANEQAVRAEMSQIRDRIKPLAGRIAREKGLDIVVTTASVLAHDEGVDITAAVFKEVNELLKAGQFPSVTIPEALPIPVPEPTTAPAPATTP